MKALILLAAAGAALAQNTLTREEAAAGWLLLFDGKTTFGWTPEGGKANWQAAGGVLKADSGDSGWLRSHTAFADFVLHAEWRGRDDVNSGVFIRSAKQGPPQTTGYEVQIWIKHPEGYNTGSLVHHVKASKAAPKGGQWHALDIQAEGDRFTVKVDGKKVLDARESKSRMGHIGLQFNKDNPIEFRNVKLRPLGMKPIFNGKNLDGWSVIDAPKPREKPVWEARGGMIHVERGPGQLETNDTWDNFILQLDIRTNPKDAAHHPNSGVFFRGDPKGYWTGYESQIRNEYKDGDRTQPVDWGTGALYSRVATREVVTNDGEFFTKTIYANGNHLAVWLNGYPVTDWDDPRPEGSNARTNARLAGGPISLQAHDPTTNLDFKNIRIVALPK